MAYPIGEGSENPVIGIEAWIPGPETEHAEVEQVDLGAAIANDAIITPSSIRDALVEPSLILQGVNPYITFTTILAFFSTCTYHSMARLNGSNGFIEKYYQLNIGVSGFLAIGAFFILLSIDRSAESGHKE